MGIRIHQVAAVVSPLLLLAACSTAGEEAIGKNAAGVSYGGPDTDHPEVCAVVWASSEIPGAGFCGGCTGTLVGPNVVLTAAHCVDWFEICPPESFKTYVAFGENLLSGEGVEVRSFPPEDFIVHPSWQGSYGADPEVIDLAVVRLPDAPHGIRPAALPPPGLLARMDERGATAELTFTFVGYGYTETLDPGALGPRRRATEGFLALLNPGWLKTDTNPENDSRFGGGCFGDSGGPLFLDSPTPGDRHIVVGTFSFMEGEVDPTSTLCQGEPNYHTRLDRPEVRSFVASSGRAVMNH